MWKIQNIVMQTLGNDQMETCLQQIALMISINVF